jgi:uncharacterized protein with gpF-like domain
MGEFGEVARRGNADGHEMRLRRILSQEYFLIFGDFGKRLAEKLGILEKKAKETPYERAVARYVTKNSLRKAADISNTTKQKIKRAIETSLAEGDMRGLEKLIREKIGGEEGRRRAETIARTESHSASQDAAFELAQESGLDLVKMWVSVEDGRTRDTHVEANGQIRELEETFDVGDEELYYPGDPSGEAGEVINCRCVCVYIPRRSA